MPTNTSASKAKESTDQGAGIFHSSSAKPARAEEKQTWGEWLTGKEPEPPTAGERIADLGAEAKKKAHNAGERASELAESAKDGASKAGERASEWAESAQKETSKAVSKAKESVAGK